MYTGPERRQAPRIGGTLGRVLDITFDQLRRTEYRMSKVHYAVMEHALYMENAPLTDEQKQFLELHDKLEL